METMGTADTSSSPCSTTPARCGGTCRPRCFSGRRARLAVAAAAPGDHRGARPPTSCAARRPGTSPCSARWWRGTAGAASASWRTKRCTMRVVKSRVAEKLIGYAGFGLYCLSPTLWSVWHNQAHHGNTGKPVVDPDGYGTLGFWQKSAVVRAAREDRARAPATRAAPRSSSSGSRSIPSSCWCSTASATTTTRACRAAWCTPSRRRCCCSGSASCFWVGAYAFLFIYVVPLLVANAVVMSYIATNHFLNPLTEINDPLANTLSVTNPRWLERLHLQFGYHVEHHLFPMMSGRHAPAVREVLVRLYGDRYLQHAARARAAAALHAAEAARHARYADRSAHAGDLQRSCPWRSLDGGSARRLTSHSPARGRRLRCVLTLLPALAQHELLDLAGAGEWELVDEHPVAWRFRCGQTLAHMGA